MPPDRRQSEGARSQRSTEREGRPPSQSADDASPAAYFPVQTAGIGRNPVLRLFSTRTTPSSTFPSETGSAARGGSTFQTTPAPSIDLPDPELPLHIATTVLKIDKASQIIALQKWTVTNTPDGRLFRWRGTDAREVLDHYVPYGVFPSTLHRDLDSTGVSFLEPHQLLFTAADGHQHPLKCTVQYAFRDRLASIEFQGNVREMILVKLFDFKYLWSERYSKRQEGEAILQSLKIWQTREPPFHHTLSFFSTKDECDRETHLLEFEANAERGPPNPKVVYLDFILHKGMAPDLDAPPRRKLSFDWVSASISKSLHKGRYTWQILFIVPANSITGTAETPKYFAIEFANVQEAKDFVEVFQNSRRADHVALITSPEGNSPQVGQTIKSSIPRKFEEVDHVVPDRSGQPSPGSPVDSAFSNYEVVSGVFSSSFSSSPVEMSPIPLRGSSATRSIPAGRAIQKDIRIAQPSFTESESSYTVQSEVRKWLTTPSHTPYTYDPLDSENEIRLLVVRPANDRNDEIRCNIIRSINQEQPPTPYEALSYTWGSNNNSRDIYVIVPEDERDRKQSFPILVWKRLRIRSNLYSAIQHLRKADQEVILWVDAICIDQENIPEKNIQVKIMSNIYRRASNVMVWLGEGSLETDELLKFIENIGDASNLNRFLEDESTVPQWTAFVKLMTNRWFSRRWVVQEVALAKRPNLTIHCGYASIRWEYFAVAVERFGEKFDSVDALVRRSQQFGSNTEPLGHVRTGAHVLVEAVHNFFPWNSDSEVVAEEGEVGKHSGEVELRSTLETLISELTSFESTDPRDTIFAILSLASDTATYDMSESTHQDMPHLEPDYDKPLFDVLKEFVDFSIKSSESLDIICRAWAPLPKKGGTTPIIGFQSGLHTREVLPSWMPSVKKSAYGTPTERLRGRQYGDSFVGTPERKNYNASPYTVAVCRFGRRLGTFFGQSPGAEGLGIFSTEDRLSDSRSKGKGVIGNQSRNIGSPRSDDSLFVMGFRLDVIERLSRRVTEGIIHRECFEIFDYHVPDPDDDVVVPPVPEVIWRTMVANLGPGGERTRPSYEQSCKKCIAYSTRGDIHINKLILNDEDELMVRFLKRVKSVVWNRQFLRTKGQRFKGPGEKLENKKLFGLAPEDAKEGDVICILLGCSVPVILREHWEPTHYFELIGEAYVHGMMSGEATRWRKKEKLLPECEEFELR